MRTPPKRKTRPEALGGLVGRVLGDLGLDGPSAAVRIAERWPEVVGADTAAHCAPHLVRGTTLEIEADSSVWVQTLRLRAPQIVERLAAVFGAEAPGEIFVRLRGPR